MPGTSAIGGLVSGFDTASLIEQLVAVSRRRVDIVVNNQTIQSDKLTAFQALNTQLSDFQSKSKALKDSDTFNVFTTSTSTTSTVFEADQLVTATTTTDASPGTHTVEFTSSSQLAQARQISSKSFSESDTALGSSYSGEFIINGTAIIVSDTDTLADIASSINTANSGSNATGVTASVISVSDTDYRMVLTSDNTGEDQFVILDASSNDMLQTLGFTDSTDPTIKNPTSDGAKSEEFTSSTTAVGSLLGLSSAQNSSTVQIDGINVTIDLAADSLTDIATTISAVDGVTASVVSTTTDGVTTYQLDISGTTDFTDSNNILEALGVLVGNQSSVAEVHTASADNYNLSNTVVTDATLYNDIYTGLLGSVANTAGAAITSATLFSAMDATIADNDTITISGTKQDGTAVADYAYTITIGNTVQDLLTNIETNFGLATGSVVIDSTGKIQINDDNSGDSQLSVAFVENNEGSGSNLDFGTYSADNNVTNGDTITLSGTKNDGTAVSATTFTIDTTKAFNDADTNFGLLAKIESVFGLSAGSATIDANGQILITDNTAGDSQLSVVISTNNEGGGTLDFGTVSVTTQGYEMETTAGQDAKVKIDGIAVTRSSNSIDDVISGVTLNIAAIENGKKVNLTISRDTDSIKTSISDFTTAYNDIIEFINQEFAYNEDTKKAGILSGEGTLRTIKSIVQATVSGTISLLPAGSNAIVLIGITSDRFGKLSLKDSTFLSEINSDFYAVKRMFVAEGTTTHSEISYLFHTKDTVAGEYAVTINTVATQASKTGSIVLTNGIGAGLTETLTITDTSTNRTATISLDGDTGENGSSIDNIVNAINSELDIERTQTLVGSIANTASATAITSSTTFDAIDSTTLANDDVITFTGTTRSGLSISDSYRISNVSTDTVQGFLSAIEKAYDSNVSATINSSGEIVLTDNADGDSSLSITITGPAGKGLDFGTVLTSGSGGITGRYAMEITASKDGSNNLVLTHDIYGSGFGFETVETNDRLGTEGTYAGVDVAGTINGEAATGAGQLLTGDAPPDASSTTSVEDLSIKVTSTSTGTKGNVTLTRGVGELMYDNIDSIVDKFDGILTARIDGLQDTIDGIQKNILAMEGRLAMETLRLETQFVQLELGLSKLQSISSFLTQQLSRLKTY